MQEPPRTREVDLRHPERQEEYPDWLTHSATVAAEAFAATDPDLPTWAWGGDQHARFWARRMLFETLLHRVDAELALGRRPTVDRPLAVDGVDGMTMASTVRCVTPRALSSQEPGRRGHRGPARRTGCRAVAAGAALQ
ncbi:maleylpyruvate isomerase N-terminal domain-containing protein [Streptomyces sp. NPDC012616]|uniref:maleylpyruvate isomerase N-terminal domain-containing protein n=1 Tax=Streptomyces sp. NPDC012616 TaxID=3364840 RepID=UPI0036E4B2A1